MRYLGGISRDFEDVAHTVNGVGRGHENPRQAEMTKNTATNVVTSRCTYMKHIRPIEDL
jgi:hypothetical protein